MSSTRKNTTDFDDYVRTIRSISGDIDLIDKKEYERHYKRLFAPNNIIRVRKDYVTSGLFTKIEALFVQDLIELSSTLSSSFDDFFPCSVQCLKDSLNWDSDTQADILRRLDKKGFISVKKIGMPALRHIKIHVSEIEKEVDRLLINQLIKNNETNS